ncbi:DUF3576 domain-containing protein [Alphaproteobacteria bacterium]|jgi:hypothetical protein|nr:DUF3576 domain-containing protein [Alphaproteobacteria bacterium]
MPKINNYWCSSIAIVSLFLLSLAVSACSSLEFERSEQEKGPVSFFTGKEGGISLANIGSKTEASKGLPVNALLWRAALDIASFVPLDDVDTFGGTIVTEWYQLGATPDRRLKLAFFIVGRELRSDAITVHAYVENRLDTEWVNAGRDKALGRKLENLVLARSRELRSAGIAETVD